MSGEIPAFEVLAWIWVGLAPLALIAGLVKWDPVERVGGTGIGPRVCPVDDCKHGAEGTLAPRLVSRDI